MKLKNIFDYMMKLQNKFIRRELKKSLVRT